MYHNFISNKPQNLNVIMDTVSSSVMKKNWDDARGRAAANYPVGISKNTSWYQAALDGQTSYVNQMMNPSVLARRATGLTTKTSQAHWQGQATALGGPRISSGMLAGKPKFDAAADTIISVLSGLILAPRVADPDQNIDNRVKPIAHALRAAFGYE